MLTEVKLALGLAALLALAGAAAGCVWYGYDWGAQTVQRKWDAQKVQDTINTQKELETERDAGYALASEAIGEKRELELSYANLSAQFEDALRSKLNCPKSGQVGDVVLPASLVTSMFITDRVPTPTARPASAGINASVQ